MEKAFAYICAPEDAGVRQLNRYCRKVYELGYVPISPKQMGSLSAFASISPAGETAACL